MAPAVQAALAKSIRPAWLVEAAVFLTGAVATLWLAGYFGVDLSQPAGLGGDHLFSLSEAKSYLDGHGFRFNSQLGFPSGQDGLYFPTFELSHKIVLWLGGRVFNSPVQSVHLLYILGLLAMFGCGYWALRRFAVRPWIAAVGAASTVVTPYLGLRAFGHDFLALSYSAPMGMALALGLADTGQTGLREILRRPFTIAAILIVGASGLYYAFFTLIFLGFVAVGASIGQRRLLPLLSAEVAGLLIFAVLIFSGYGFDLPLVLSGQISGPPRAASDQLFYGLDLPSIAYAFNAVPKIALGLSYARDAMPAAFANEGVGEWPGWPLTLIIVCAPLLAAISHDRRRDPSDWRPDRLAWIGWAALCIVLGLIFGARGGLGFLFNLVTSGAIRGDSRLMPFLVFAAVLILCLAAEMAAASKQRVLRVIGPLVAALLLVAAMLPTVGVLARRQQAVLADPQQRSLLTGVRGLLAAKDRAHLGAFLQLPQVKWPEAPPIREFDPYRHLLPYLFDHPRNGSRWSYGANAGQRQAALLSFVTRESDGLAGRARAFGFDGLIIQKAAYEPAALAALQASLDRQLGAACRIYDDQWTALYALKPGTGHGC